MDPSTLYLIPGSQTVRLIAIYLLEIEPDIKNKAVFRFYCIIYNTVQQLFRILVISMIFFSTSQGLFLLQCLGGARVGVVCNGVVKGRRARVGRVWGLACKVFSHNHTHK